MLRVQPSLRNRRRAAYENPRPEVQALVPRGARRILDLGCSSGALGAALKARQVAEVVGIEVLAEYADDARDRLDQVLEADLELTFAAAPPPQLGRFDCLIAADVLEHLRDPWQVLASAAELLTPGGTAVISVPNVQYWDTVRQLVVRGTWPRHEEGIFDRSHLRWFTGADAAAMMSRAGVPATEVERQYRLRPGDWRTERAARLVARGPMRPFLVYQYVMAGRKAPAGPQGG
jgi:2-polyprenyl-3-methyl-5-hydroxy-6-metoxy-1,4-benzoquinol methylase